MNTQRHRLDGIRRRFAAVALAAVALAISSCGNGDGRKPVFPVTGRVLFEGKPADKALVIFHPVGESGPAVIRPRGQVGPDGTFTLATYGTADGAPAGTYQVTVELWLASTRKGEDDRPPLNRLPVRYSKPGSSGLHVQIEPRPNELKAFELKR